MKKYWLLLSVCLLIASCKVEPEEIHYGADGCSFCKMTIVDTQHAAQIVTTKGKVFKYDAIECMVNDLKDWDQAPVKFLLATDYANPKKLIDATHAHYLISDKIPSPMGANLSAFGNLDDLKKVIVHDNGITMSWNQLTEHFKQ